MFPQSCDLRPETDCRIFIVHAWCSECVHTLDLGLPAWVSGPWQAWMKNILGFPIKALQYAGFSSSSLLLPLTRPTSTCWVLMAEIRQDTLCMLVSVCFHNLVTYAQRLQDLYSACLMFWCASRCTSDLLSPQLLRRCYRTQFPGLRWYWCSRQNSRRTPAQGRPPFASWCWSFHYPSDHRSTQHGSLV
jgi:hypothetical protein